MAFGLQKFGSFTLRDTSGLVAVDFGSQALKVLQLAPTEPPQLIAAACVQTPAELANDATKRLEFQIEQLATLMKTGGFKAKRAMCAIPTAQMFCKHLQLELAEKQNVDTAAAEVVAAQLGCEASLISCRTVVVNGAVVAGGKSEVIALATAKSLVMRLMQGLKSAKLEPAGLISEYQAILSAFRPVNRRAADADTATLYLDIGASATKLCVGHGTNLVFAKVIGLGGRYLDQVVARQAGCSMNEARALRLGMQTLTNKPAAPAAITSETAGLAVLAAAMRKEETGGTAVATKPATDPAQAAQALASGADRARSSIDLTESLKALTDEVQMCVRYYDSLFPSKKIARAIFIGGESRHTALCQHIARVLRTPASSADPLARVARVGVEPVAGVDFTQPQPGWTVPYGLLMNPTDC